MKKLILMSTILFASVAQAEEAGKRVCKYTKFGLNDSDEICAVVTPGNRGTTILRMATDVATYDPSFPSSRVSVAAALCKLFDLGQNVFASMAFRKADQAGFIGGGAILGAGFKKISAIDTLRCESR